MVGTSPQIETRINVDPTNPGQFFACCGLLELADRLWPGTEGWFENGEFVFGSLGEQQLSLEKLLRTVTDAELRVEEPDEPTTSPLTLGAPLKLRLDWWRDDRGGGSTFKTWAG